MRTKSLVAGLTVGLMLSALPALAGASAFNAHSVAVSSDGSRVAGGQSGNNYSVFSRNATTSALTPLGPFSPPIVGGGSGCFCQAIAFNPDAQSIYSTVTGQNSIVAATVTVTGATVTQTYANNSNGITGMISPQAITLSPGNNNVYVTVGSPGTGGIVVFSRAVNGTLTFVEKEPLPSGGATGGEIQISPDGKFAYMVSGNNVEVLSRDLATGALSGVTATPPPGGSGSVFSLALSADGAFLFGIDQGAGGRVYEFSRDATTGLLTHQATIQNGSGGVSGLDGANGVAVSPDNANLYVVSDNDNALATFGLNGTTGALTFQGALFDGGGGVDGLNAARGIVVSADGKSIYVAAANDNGIGVFTRNPANGAPTYVQLANDESAANPPKISIADASAIEGNSGEASVDLQVALNPSSINSVTVNYATSDGGATQPSDYTASSGTVTFNPGQTSKTISIPIKGDIVTEPNETLSVDLSSPAGAEIADGHADLTITDDDANLVFIGNEGVTVNQGAQYTNDPNVVLTIVSATNATEVRLSNDGGFGTAQARPIAAAGTYPWKLDSSGPERLPKTVYVRFTGLFGTSATTFQDDIILDETPPEIVDAAIADAGTGKTGATKAETVKLQIKATDNASGVDGMQITDNKRKPPAWKPYKTKAKLKTSKSKIYVRVRDKATNVSGWKRAK
jgi:6-phosphogluconolactonase (cycloisomerase 2 family)